MLDAAQKLCRRCGVLHPVEEFAWKRKSRGQRNSHCRACQKALMQAHYQANREIYIERARRAKRDVRLARTLRLLEYFAEHPCTDCSEDDPVVLEFDHLGEKDFAVGQKLAQHPWERVLAEIRKCEVVCANCHARRTAERRGSLRWRLTQETA